MLAGLYPIAQVREPYSAVGFLAERVPVEKVYGLTLEDPSKPWSAWELCERYAQKRDYTTRHGAWDTYRAGNEILRCSCSQLGSWGLAVADSFSSVRVQRRAGRESAAVLLSAKRGA